MSLASAQRWGSNWRHKNDTEKQEYGMQNSSCGFKTNTKIYVAFFIWKGQISNVNKRLTDFSQRCQTGREAASCIRQLCQQRRAGGQSSNSRINYAMWTHFPWRAARGVTLPDGYHYEKSWAYKSLLIHFPCSFI